MIQGIRRQQIIMVEQRNIFPRRHSDSRVGVIGYTSILCQAAVPDAVLTGPCRNLSHSLLHSIAGTRIYDDQFPHRIALSAHGFYHLTQELLLRLIGRHHNTELFPAGRRLCPLRGQLLRRRLPVEIIRLPLFFDPFSGRVICVTYPVFLKILNGFPEITDPAYSISHI